MSALSARGGLRVAGALLSHITILAPVFASALRRDARGMIRLMWGHRRAVARAAAGPAWNLALLATVPEHRGKGLARSLLERQLYRCDQDGIAAWLEANDPVNVPIYERFGFETVALLEGTAWLPGIWVMRREPRLP